jgi:hypothetical protein
MLLVAGVLLVVGGLGVFAWGLWASSGSLAVDRLGSRLGVRGVRLLHGALGLLATVAGAWFIARSLPS